MTSHLSAAAASSAAEDAPPRPSRREGAREPARDPAREPVREAVREPLREAGGEEREWATAVWRLLLGAAVLGAARAAGERGKDAVRGDVGLEVGGDVGRDAECAVGCRSGWDVGCDLGAVDVDLRDADDGMDTSAALSAGDARTIMGAGVAGRVGGELGTARAASSSFSGVMSSRVDGGRVHAGGEVVGDQRI
jgi:hypothetical protein